MAPHKKFPALGRGLDALIQTEEVQTDGSSSINEIELSLIHPNPNQPRHEFDGETLQELADSIKEHLQVFITEYRTKKARTDLEYYTRLTAEAKATYEKAQQKYAAFCDASNNVALKSVELKMEAMEHDMEAKFTLYTAMNARKESALAKIQERPPALTELKNTTVPLKPAGPKRMIFVAVMLFLATIGTIAHICRKELAEWF